jgi:DNA adenine methylase
MLPKHGIFSTAWIATTTSDKGAGVVGAQCPSSPSPSWPCVPRVNDHFTTVPAVALQDRLARPSFQKYHFRMKFTFDAKPVLKWAGGKQALADQLIRYFPPSFSCYYEPFLGGGSVLLALQPEKAIVGDRNDWLLDTYIAIRTDHARIAKILDDMVNTREAYERIRKIRPESLELFRRAAHFIYLNKTCFRGLFRVNKTGLFNVPYGAYDRRYYDPDNLGAVARRLQSVEIRYGDFEICLADVTPDDFVYLDPPYYKQGGFSDFDRYTKFKFRENDQIRLTAVCRELDERGIRWAVSNSDTPFVRTLFEGFNMLGIANRREINLKSQERGIDELLITNYE